MSEHISVERNNRILEITLRRTEKKNALTQDMYAALISAITDVEADTELNAILFMGDGDVFCAGNDVAEFAALPADFDIKSSNAAKFFRLLNSTDIPLVAAVQGAAIGVGMTMLMHFDYVLADYTAFFQTPFVDLGLVADCGCSITLPSTMTHQQVSELVLLGEPIDAERAMLLGFVNRVVSPAKLVSEARSLASRLAQKPPQAIRLNKRLLKNNRAAVDQRIDEELSHFSERLTSQEVRQIIAVQRKKAGTVSQEINLSGDGANA